MRQRLPFVLAGLLVAVGCGSNAASSPPLADGGSLAETGATPDAAARDTGAADAHKVGDCSGLAAAGVWEDVTPPAIRAQVECGDAATCGFGVSAFVLDPTTTGTAYLGTSSLGVWKTTDCGATWVHINTGSNGAALDGGANWTFAIDPVNPGVLYTNTGYGTMGNGAFKSANGGVDWQPLWPPSDAASAPLAKSFQYNFIGTIVLDPTDHTHLVLTFHEGCCTPSTCGTATPAYTAVCMAETHDAGGSWRLIRGEQSWVGGEGQAAWFLDGSSHWLWASASNGIWQTTDDGATWTLVLADGESHGSGQLYRAHDGTYYLAGRTGILRSPDGTTWSLVPNSGTLMSGLTGNGSTMWASSGYPYNAGQRPAPYAPFSTSAENDGHAWTAMASPRLADGGPLAYDPDHRVLYSSNLYGGFWRVVTP